MTGGPRRDRIQARALVEAWTDAPLSCLIADRGYDRDAFRVGRAQRDIKAVIPARCRRTNLQPHAPERYPVRNAGERGISVGSNTGAA